MNKRKLSTGITPLDRELSGGLHAGSIISLTAPPKSSSEIILRDLATKRTTLYLTTTRTELSVRESFRAVGINPQTENIFIGEVDASDVESDALMQGCLDRIEEMFTRMMSDQYKLPEEDFNIIIDKADILEFEKHGWLTKFFKNLRKLMAQVDCDGLVVLHCSESPNRPPRRDLTLSMVDVVLNLQMIIEGNDISYRLFIPKNRTGRSLMEGFKLELETEVDVDKSRDI